MPAIPASTLAPWVNGYTIRPGLPKAIVVPQASSLAVLQDAAVSGTLLPKQAVALDARSGTRTVSVGATGGAYGIEADGDLHVCLGGKALQPHITCEVQHATPWLATFAASVGQPITATACFRCLFEHPGFQADDDAHIFELHPVHAVTLGGTPRTFDVGLPDPASIHTWTTPYPLNVQDGKIRVAYDRAADTLAFTNMDGQDENYVRVAGVADHLAPSPDGSVPASFSLTSADVGHPIQVLVLPQTNAAVQFARLAPSRITLVALRSVDLEQALAGRYVIRLIAIDIQSGA